MARSVVPTPDATPPGEEAAGAPSKVSAVRLPSSSTVNRISAAPLYPVGNVSRSVYAPGVRRRYASPFTSVTILFPVASVYSEPEVLVLVYMLVPGLRCRCWPLTPSSAVSRNSTFAMPLCVKESNFRSVNVPASTYLLRNDTVRYLFSGVSVA